MHERHSSGARLLRVYLRPLNALFVAPALSGCLIGPASVPTDGYPEFEYPEYEYVSCYDDPFACGYGPFLGPIFVVDRVPRRDQCDAHPRQPAPMCDPRDPGREHRLAVSGGRVVSQSGRLASLAHRLSRGMRAAARAASTGHGAGHGFHGGHGRR